MGFLKEKVIKSYLKDGRIQDISIDIDNFGVEDIVDTAKKNTRIYKKSVKRRLRSISRF